ncbi:GTPase RsgA [archaeon]|jgi:ribosome biogenesis GTPase A|nr:GTPase RsgA [archaeon]MBT4417144.1 GTPase RsgA [archaeon]
MKPFWPAVNKVIKYSNIIIEVLDARFPELTRNQEIEDKIKRKKLILVLNKCDLVDKKEVEAWAKEHNALFVSATKRLGTTMLKRKIISLSKGKTTVGVLGYPNTGKSSIINVLAGRRAAKTSPQSGYTKGRQLIRMSPNIYLFDTPGVLPYKEKDELKHSLTSTKDFTKVKDPETVAFELIKLKKTTIQKFYKLESDDPEELLEELGQKLGKLKKGGKVNFDATARIILKDWQRGKIKG